MVANFVRTKSVVVPIIKTNPGESIYVTFLQPITLVEKVDERSGEVLEPLPVALVLNLTDGQDYHLVLGTVLYKEICRNYAADEYVGKSFEIKKEDKTDKKYFKYELYEIEVK